MVSKGAQAAGIVAGMLTSGTLITLNVKTLYQTQAEGLEGMGSFTKPWFLSFAMFLGMLFALPLHFALGTENPDVPWSEVAWRCSFPALCDLMATTFGSMGLIFVSASTFQICRGASVVFVAIFTVLFLKRSLNRSQVSGVLMVVMALCVIGRASVAEAGKTAKPHEDPSAAAARALFGVMLIVGAQVFQAVQFVWEEKQMKQLKLPPLLLCGIEGTFGTLMMLLIFFPVLSVLPGHDAHGSLESIHDTWVKIQNSATLRVLVVSYILAVFILNCCGVYCTKVLSGMHRSLVQTGLRTMCVWASGIALFNFTDGAYGEPWVGWTSILEVMGFITFLCGFFLYSGVLKLPSMFQACEPVSGYAALAGSPPKDALKVAQESQQP